MSGSTFEGVKLNVDSMKFLNICRHDAPKDFKPYSARHKIIAFPLAFFPHYIPASNHIFSLQGTFKYAFPMSQANISSPFNAVIRNAILTLSLDTTLE